MTRLLLVRHGQAQVNADARLSSAVPGTALTEQGREQARQVAGRLGDDVQHVYASPLRRATETGEIIAAELGVSLTVVAELAEVGIGDLEGQPGSDDTVLLHPVFQAWQGGDDLDSPLPGGETGADLVRRTGSVLSCLRERHRGGTAVAVTHGGVLAAAVPNLARDVPLDRARAQIPLNTAVVTLTWDDADQTWSCTEWPATQPGRTAQAP